jgi:hypothetical protein
VRSQSIEGRRNRRFVGRFQGGRSSLFKGGVGDGKLRVVVEVENRWVHDRVNEGARDPVPHEVSRVDISGRGNETRIRRVR